MSKHGQEPMTAILLGLVVDRGGHQEHVPGLQVFRQRIDGDDLAGPDRHAPVAGDLLELPLLQPAGASGQRNEHAQHRQDHEPSSNDVRPQSKHAANSQLRNGMP